MKLPTDKKQKKTKARLTSIDFHQIYNHFLAQKTRRGER